MKSSHHRGIPDLYYSKACLVIALGVLCGGRLSALAERSATVFYADCSSSTTPNAKSIDAEVYSKVLHSLAEVNAIAFVPGDALLFKRNTVCTGVLEPQGSGRDGSPIRIGTYGTGSLPRIEAAASDDAALHLRNQEFWEIGSLEIRGGRSSGVLISADTGTMHHIHLSDLRVHDVRGVLKAKESGLIVINALGQQAGFEDVELDGVVAYNTTQWSGIFISGASHVRVRNSMVHDVQGDGIVAFTSRDVIIEHSVAWHTGMQHQVTIGTPNAIWTWRCTDCIVQENEAFLADSPGVDGGAFDIDWGNTGSTVRRNFGHDTVGYCISVFGAEGPTVRSVVADNLCVNNATSPRLAARQGALLLMTWQGGSLDGVEIRGNQIDWQASGDTPAVQTGDDLRAQRVTLSNNEIWSTGINFVAPDLKYAGENNRYEVSDRSGVGFGLAQSRLAALNESGSTLMSTAKGEAGHGAFGIRTTREPGWTLVASVPAGSLRHGGDDLLRATIVALKSAALQFSHAGLKVELASDGDLTTIAGDWSLAADGVICSKKPVSKYSLALVSPQHKIVRAWPNCPGPVEVGLALRKHAGPPVFGWLTMEKVQATD